MKRLYWLLFAAPVFAQTPQPPQPPQAPTPPPARFEFQKDRFMLSRSQRSGDSLYDSGTASLDAGRWEQAVATFTKVADAKGAHAEGALYWKAYAENRLGQRDAAAATIATLIREYPNSRWLDDAKALETEIRLRAGQPVSPDAESNDDLKMYALNGLLQSDPDQAIPIVEKLLKSGNSPKLKDRALFVLTQSRSPKAQQLLLTAAKGSVNPDLQIRALRYMAISGGSDNRATLYSIYSSSTDLNVKRAILNSLSMSKFTGAGDPLAMIAKTEKNADLRQDAIRKLGIAPASQTSEILTSLYASEQEPAIRKEIVSALFIQRNAKALIEIARKESNPAMKKDLVEKLSLMHSKDATDYMLEILSK